MLTQLVDQKNNFGTLPLTKELMKQAKKAVLSRFDSVKTKRQERIKEYDRLEKIYLSGTQGSTADKRTLSQVMTTDGFNAVEDWVALVQDAMFPTDPPFDIEGKKSILANDIKLKIKKVLSENMLQTDYRFEFEKVSRQGVKFGTFAAKGAYWQTDQKPEIFVEDVAKTLEVTDENGQTTTMTLPETDKKLGEKIVVEGYPGYKFVDLRKLYFRHDKANWVMELIDSTWDEVEKLSSQPTPIYDNLKKAKKTTLSKDDTKDLENIPGDQDVELLEAHHIPLEIETAEGKKTVLCIVTLANREEVIRVQPTPYREAPYLFCQFMEKNGVEGMGLLEILDKMLTEINTRRTQALDANTMGLYGMKAVNMRYIKKPEQLRIRKDGLIELKETDKPINEIISFLRPPVEYANIAMDLLARISSDVIRTTRMKGVLAGEKVSPNPTASEWQGMMKEALKSVKIILERISRYQMEEWLKRAYVLNVLNREKSWVYVISPEQKDIMGPVSQPQLVEISPEEIYSDGIDIRPLGITYMRDEIVVRQQQMQKLDLLMKYGNLPLVNEKGQPVRVDFYKQLKDLLIAFGEERPDEVFVVVPPPPIMPMTGGPGMPGQGPNGNGGPPKLPMNLSQQGVPPNLEAILQQGLGGSPGKVNF
jgi:hypothetical protein